MDQLSVVRAVKAPVGVAIAPDGSIADDEAGVRPRNPKLALGLPIPSGAACSVHLPEEAAVGVAARGVDLGPDRDPGPDRIGAAVAAIHVVGDPVCLPNGVATTNGTIPGAVAAVGGDGHAATRRIIRLAVVVVRDRGRDRSPVPVDRDRGLRPVLLPVLGIHRKMSTVDQRNRQRERSFTWVG